MYNFKQAQEIGLIDDVVEIDNLMNAAKDKAKRFSNDGSSKYIMTKAVYCRTNGKKSTRH